VRFHQAVFALGFATGALLTQAVGRVGLTWTAVSVAAATWIGGLLAVKETRE
jgi:hypothetical protein